MEKKLLCHLPPVSCSMGMIIIFLLFSCSEPIKDPNTLAVKSTIYLDADDVDSILLKAAHVVPTANQYAALQDEFIAFIHFGPNAFTRLEWGSGMEDPRIFNLKSLDTDQWCEAMKAAGMKKVIFTAKHHDGFCLWQSRYTEHGVMSSPFKNGKGDVLKELAESCHTYGLKLGVYLSPADLYQIESPAGLYGNLSKATPRSIPGKVDDRPFQNKTTFTFEVDDYNEYFLNQLFELLTEYGPIHEVWFDGAHPKRKGGQQYNYMAWKELIQDLAPEAVIFGRQDIRWCGNESGKTRETEWNVIPYDNDPNAMSRFADLTTLDLGSKKQLIIGKYLHYQPAETNTSIREGWFYRDEIQNVRSTEDIFDIYERAVGGNSTFLLNIPPNRDGKFSDKDVSVLEAVGQRIKETYQENLLADAKGIDALLDSDADTYIVVNEDDPIINIRTDSPITINRWMIQEKVDSHGERVEEHILEAKIDGHWQELASATNIGYKRILRFPTITTDNFRVKIDQQRFIPVISSMGAYYAKPHPPSLRMDRTAEGLVSITPFTSDFSWKPHYEDTYKNLYPELEIYYTTDGSIPDSESHIYDGPFAHAEGTVSAIAIVSGESGEPNQHTFGILKTDWNVVSASSSEADHPDVSAIDGDNDTYWLSKASDKKHSLVIDLGKIERFGAVVYTPPGNYSDGMMEKGKLLVSEDGKKWNEVTEFQFGNLINDPTPRKHYLNKEVTGKYIQLIATTIAGNGKNFAVAEIDLLRK